jgi:hypothetical protein
MPSCPCCKGACCCGTICTAETEQDCLDAFGTWAGPGTQCADEVCNQPTGACCGTACAVLSECECLQGSGEYQGDGTTCSPDPCAECVATCGVTSEVVWYEDQTGAFLQHDGDSFPQCDGGDANHRPLPEVISGSFTLGTSTGCGGGISCGCVLQFRFWRNLFSTCLGGTSADITTQTVAVVCNAGSVEVKAASSTYTLASGATHTFTTINFDSRNEGVADSTVGECFSVRALSPTASFSVQATLNWSTSTDHDLYGSIACGLCA